MTCVKNHDKIYYWCRRGSDNVTTVHVDFRPNSWGVLHMAFATIDPRFWWDALGLFQSSWVGVSPHTSTGDSIISTWSSCGRLQVGVFPGRINFTYWYKADASQQISAAHSIKSERKWIRALLSDLSKPIRQ